VFSGYCACSTTALGGNRLHFENNNFRLRLAVLLDCPIILRALLVKATDPTFQIEIRAVEAIDRSTNPKRLFLKQCGVSGGPVWVTGP